MDFNFVKLPHLSLSVAKTHVTRHLLTQIWPDIPAASLWQPGLPDTVPATHITWDEANAWIARFNAPLDEQWRLPTAAEAKAIALAGREALPADEDELRLEAVAWENCGGVIHSVGSLRPSPAGLFDVVGNVWTWCSDAEEKSEYGGKYVYPVASIFGGSHYYSAKALSAAMTAQMWRSCRADIGLRLVADLPKPATTVRDMATISDTMILTG
jgi:formylglycine-generating enzyme required for sulfatase activity